MKSLQDFVALAKPLFTAHLRETLAIRGAKRVVMHEPLTNLRKVVAIVVDRNMPTTELSRKIRDGPRFPNASG